MSCNRPRPQEDLLGVTIGCATLESGCTSTVCGRVWLDTYIDTLSNSESSQVSETPPSKIVRFGDGEICVIKTVAYRAWTDRHTAHARTDKK